MLGTLSEPRRGRMSHICDISALRVNERQKKDREFSSMLDSVRCGFPTDETLQILNKKVLNR